MQLNITNNTNAFNFVSVSKWLPYAATFKFVSVSKWLTYAATFNFNTVHKIIQNNCTQKCI